MPSISVREYHPDSGALLGNIGSLGFGRVTAGIHSRVKVIDIAFNEITAVGNLKLGLISSGGLTVNTSPQDVTADGTSSNGYFGIEYSKTFDSNKASQPLVRHFSGLNTAVSAGDTRNVSIGNRSPSISDFIYLDIQVGAANVVAGNGAYKVFFDYS
jgi:FlaG/FlaF family flagellin (archaellin)